MSAAAREELVVPGAMPAISHYTEAVKFGNLLFISGITAHDEQGNLIGGDDAAAQTRQIFVNMKRILEAAGASFADILKVTVFVLDMADRQRINPVRQEFFGTTKPASTLVEVKGLALPGMLVEIEAVAGLRGG